MLYSSLLIHTRCGWCDGDAKQKDQINTYTQDLKFEFAETRNIESLFDD